MPTIPTHTFRPRATGQQAVLANTGMYDRQAAAAARIGQSIAGIGEQLAGFAFQKQNQINKGIVSEVDTMQMGAQSDIETFARENPANPESWTKFAETRWKQFDDDVARMRKDGNWGEAVSFEVSESTKQYRARVGVQLRGSQQKALIAKSNAQIETNAQARLRAGDYDGYVAQIDQMDLTTEQRESRVRDGLNQGLYHIASNNMDAIEALPMAERIAEYEAIKEELSAKDGDTYANYEFDRGGLSLGGRQKLISNANARIRATQRAMDTTSKALLRGLASGKNTLADVQEAMELGQIDEATAKAFAPQMEAAQSERKLAEAEKRKASTERLRKRLLEKKDAGLMEIDRQIATGEITRVEGEQLKTQLAQASLREQVAAPEYSSIKERIDGGFGAKMFGRQPSDAEYQSILEDITEADLTQTSRYDLMDRFLNMKLADIGDLEEEGQSGRWGDRDITPAERDLRKTLIARYKTLLPNMGVGLAGDLLFNQESEIRSFFDMNPKATPQQVESFLNNHLLPKVNDAAGIETLSEAFLY